MYTSSTRYVKIEFATALFLLPKPMLHVMLEQFAVSSNVPHISVVVAIVKIIRLFHMMICDPISLQKNPKRGNLVKTSNCFEV